ncbi:MAG: FAD-binding protein, partial [Pyrinomonadaceae bacterium]|nr:FAD-binding protein [Pyrinomonadaceae bacterium]
MVNAQLSRAVLPFGLYYVPDPSSQAACTVGGNIAENAGGIHCLKYGTTTDHVLATRIVLSNGEIVELGGAATGGAASYDLLGVFVGSEGTFGIATEATVRLTPTPQAVRTLLADFTDVDDASRAVSAIIAGGLIPAALEMVDGATIRAVEASVFAAGLPTDAEAALLIELDGLEFGLDDEAARCEKICLTSGARGVRRAANEYERKKLWAARKGAFGAMGRISPDLMLQDAVVPRSRLPEVLAATYRIAAKYNLRIANVFHAGDGNLHPFISFDARDEGEVRRVKEAGREIMETCVRAGGTITGEHGVGMDKREYLPMIFSADDLDAMLRVRAAFDPSGLCNPGKIIPAPPGCGEARRVVAQAAARADVARTLTPTGDHADASPEIAHREIKHLSTAPNSPGVNRSTGKQTGRIALPHVTAQAGASYLHSTLFKSEPARQACARIVGEAHVAASPHAPGALVVAPATAKEVCEILRLASAEGWKIMPAGAGTWLNAGNPVRGANVIVKCDRLTSIVEHEPADLVATVEAGTTLSELNGVLSDSGQWLPLDSPDDGRATLGGVAATGLGGAQTFGYGLPRGHVLGMRVALADGRIIKAGGRVVKNVAGYDLCKLFVGSYGTLGVITELTFKLRPRSAREATIVALAGDYSVLLSAARKILSSQLLPVAVEILSPLMGLAINAPGGASGYALLVRFAGTEGAVLHQTEQATQLLQVSLPASAVETVNDDSRLWSNLAAAPMKHSAQLIWRAHVLPTELGNLLAEVERRSEALRQAPSMWQAGVGDGRLRVFEAHESDNDEPLQFLNKLRKMAGKNGGALTVEHATPHIKHAFDSWGMTEATNRLMRNVKEQLDPQNVLSPGRFM